MLWRIVLLMMLCCPAFAFAGRASSIKKLEPGITLYIYDDGQTCRREIPREMVKTDTFFLYMKDGSIDTVLATQHAFGTTEVLDDGQRWFSIYEPIIIDTWRQDGHMLALPGVPDERDPPLNEWRHWRTLDEIRYVIRAAKAGRQRINLAL